MTSFVQTAEQHNCFGGVCNNCDNNTDDDTIICACDGDYDEVCDCDDSLVGVCSASGTGLLNGNSQVGCPTGMWGCRDYDTPGCGLGDPGQAQICSDADVGQCPIIYDLNNANPINATSAVFTLGDSVDGFYDGNPAQLNCSYNAEDFDIADYAYTWQSYGWETQDQDLADQNLNEIIIPAICSRTASSVESGYEQYCPIDPTIPGGNTKMTDCSRYVLVGDPQGYQQLCQGWYLTSGNQDLAAQASSDYCTPNNTADCKCVNRGNNSTFKALELQPVLQDTNNNCWWLPCSTEPAQPFLHGQSQIANPCDPAEDICAQVKVAVDNIDTSINSGESSGVIACGQSDTGGGGDTRNFNAMVLILVAGIIILLLIAVMTIIHIIHSKKK